MILKRQIYREVIKKRLKSMDIGWLAHKGYTYFFLNIEATLKTGYAPAPLACGLVITENCNMRCPMCILPNRHAAAPNADQDTDTWRMVIDQLHDLKIGGIAISGGEPTTRNDVFKILAKASARKNTTVTLNSNMVSWNDKIIDAVIKTNIDNINVSIDSGKEDVKDELRGGKGVLKRVIQNIQKLITARDETGNSFSVTAVSTLSDKNMDDLDALFRIVAESKANRLCFIPLHDIKDGKTYIVPCKKSKSDLLHTLIKLSEKYNVKLENSYNYLNEFHHVMNNGLMRERCNAGYTHLVIGKDLKIYRCIPFMNMGKYLFKWNPRETKLKDLWNSTTWRKDRLYALECKQCFWDCHAEVNFLIPM
jgi:MoaA/NifB/PqqE/SkfB family radical SAM enzyme